MSSLLVDDLGDLNGTSLEVEPIEPLLVVILRWASVVPVAILGALVAGLVAYLISFLGSGLAGFGFVGDDPRHFVLAAGASAYGSVYCAAWIAPERYEAHVALGLGVLLSLIAVLAFAVNLMGGNWIGVLQNLAAIIGTVWGVQRV